MKDQQVVDQRDEEQQKWRHWLQERGGDGRYHTVYEVDSTGRRLKAHEPTAVEIEAAYEARLMANYQEALARR